MPAARASWLRGLVAVATCLVLASGAGAVPDVEATGGVQGCPPPIDLTLSTSYRGSTHGSIMAILRPHGQAGGDKALPGGTLIGPQMGIKIALPAGLCPQSGSATPALKSAQRPRFEGTATGGVNVYWSNITFTTGSKGIKFTLKTTAAPALTRSAVLNVTAMAYVSDDPACNVKAQPLKVKRKGGG